MTEAFWIALIVGVGSPILLAVIQQWFKRAERAEDFARQDIVAARAEAARAEAAAGRTEIKAVSVQIDGLLAKRDKDRIEEGRREEKIAGEKTAEALARGQEEGRAHARESAAATAAQAGPLSAVPAGPVPVADDRTAVAAERSAAATERVATAAEEKK